MPVIDLEPQNYSGSYTRGFAETTSGDCDRGNKLAWDQIDGMATRKETLRDEAKSWLDLQETLESFGVRTAGELPEAVYDDFRRKLEKPIQIT
jgi:hypothetical protein